jgi:hypothetical protein
MRLTPIALITFAFTTLLLVAAARADDFSTVRYQKEGGGHLYLSTHYPVVVGDREVSLRLFLLADRYVVTYEESKRKSASESEVLVQRELAGAAAGGSLSNLGTLRLTNETKNGKPVVELTLGNALGIAPQGLVIKLAWTRGSWAPRSVTGG